MSIFSVSYLVYHCTCDKCNISKSVTATTQIYNPAQAVRSLGWSYGKDKSILCDKCRKNNYNDNYAKRNYFK